MVALPGKYREQVLVSLSRNRFLRFVISSFFLFFGLSVVAPDISVVGYDGDWYMGRENVQMTCKANANPPPHHFRWIRCVYLCV